MPSGFQCSNNRVLGSFLYRVSKNSYLFDFNRHRIPVLEEDLGRPREPNPFWRTGDDDGARGEGGPLGKIGHDFLDIEDHIRGVGVLPRQPR